MKELGTLEEFNNCLKENDKVAVDFTATWCGPCQMIGPKFKAMEENFGSIMFVKVDVDANDETAAQEKISAMPTFKFYKGGKEDIKLSVVGASAEKLKISLEKLSEM